MLNTQTEELKAKWEDSSRNEGLMSDLKEMMTNEEQKIIHIKVRFKFCDKYHCLSDADSGLEISHGLGPYRRTESFGY